MKEIIQYLDDFLTRTGRTSISPVEANTILERAGLLKDSKTRPGKPLRDLLRKGQLPHAFQSNGKGSGWIIPHSYRQTTKSLNNINLHNSEDKVDDIKNNISVTNNIGELKKQLETARLKYKPESIKYLLVAEAPPNNIERFFYYDNVNKHDYLFLGVAQALYPELKDKFLMSGRRSEIKNFILNKLKEDGFYLLDLSELPLSLIKDDLSSQLLTLVDKIKKVADNETKIILIKATVYDAAFHFLKDQFGSVVDVRIPFPGQGGQKLFQIKFNEALKLANYI